MKHLKLYEELLLEKLENDDKLFLFSGPSATGKTYLAGKKGILPWYESNGFSGNALISTDVHPGFGKDIDDFLNASGFKTLVDVCKDWDDTPFSIKAYGKELYDKWESEASEDELQKGKALFDMLTASNSICPNTKISDARVFNLAGISYLWPKGNTIVFDDVRPTILNFFNNITEYVIYTPVDIYTGDNLLKRRKEDSNINYMFKLERYCEWFQASTTADPTFPDQTKYDVESLKPNLDKLEINSEEFFRIFGVTKEMKDNGFYIKLGGTQGSATKGVVINARDDKSTSDISINESITGNILNYNDWIIKEDIAPGWSTSGPGGYQKMSLRQSILNDKLEKSPERSGEIAGTLAGKEMMAKKYIMKYLKLYESFITEAKRSNHSMFRLYAETVEDGEQVSNSVFSADRGEKVLILLPGSGKDGGQGKDDFQLLADSLGEDFSVYSADFVNAFDVREYAKNIADEINANDDIKQCAVGGFSIGAGMAWHLAKALEGSKKFNNQLFFIDGGIANSTKEFAENIVTKANTPRIAIATRMKLIKKARSGGNFTPEEDESVKRIYSQKELDDFKKTNEGNYIEYVGKDFPPDNDTELDLVAKAIDEKNPDDVYIIEDKYDKTKFNVRYSVKPKEIESLLFSEGDVINLRKFVENDTLQKKGLGRETESGEMLPKLNGVEVISLVAGDNEGKAKTEDDIKESEEDAKGSTTGDSEVIVIPGTEHKNITKSPELATNISFRFK